MNPTVLYQLPFEESVGATWVHWTYLELIRSSCESFRVTLTEADGICSLELHFVH